MASEDLGYWTFRGSDVRALLFYLSGDVQGAGDCPRVSRGECGGGAGEEGQGRERERETQIRQKRGEGIERNEESLRETLRRESVGDGNEERGRWDWREEQERHDHFSQGGTEPQLIIPSYLHLPVPSLTFCI